MSQFVSLARRLLVAAAMFGCAVAASAGTYTFTPNDGNGDTNDFDDFDHYTYWTWGFKTFAIPAGQQLVSAKITITQINNWSAAENNANWLNIWLLDRAVTGTANNSTTNQYEAVYNSSSSIADGKLVKYTDNDGSMDIFQTWNPTIRKTKLTTYSDNNGGDNGNYVDFSYTFTSAQLLALNNYIKSGNNFALGFDPDCHYWNTGVSFQIITAVVPPPVYVPDGSATIALLGLSCGAMAIGRRFLRSKSKR